LLKNNFLTKPILNQKGRSNPAFFCCWVLGNTQNPIPKPNIL